MCDRNGRLVLADGTSFSGILVGDEIFASGEVCFVTSMTGYLEWITDPVSSGKIMVFTYPMIGNYGVQPKHALSAKVYASGLVVRELCSQPSNFESELTLHTYLQHQGVALLQEVDTRAVARHLRLCGEQRGVIRTLDTELREVVDCTTSLKQDSFSPQHYPGAGMRVALLDYGAAEHLLKELQRAGCAVTRFAADSAAATILAEQPEALLLSDGPGNPDDYRAAAAVVREVATRLPVFAFGLGHQILAQAFGAASYRMRLGHRGSNHPVRAAASRQIEITRQNHGYAISAESLTGSGLEITHSELHDDTVEGLRHRELPLWSLQYFPDCAELRLDQVPECAEFWREVRQRREERGGE